MASRDQVMMSSCSTTVRTQASQKRRARLQRFFFSGAMPVCADCHNAIGSSGGGGGAGGFAVTPGAS
jgi:cytochrome c553